MSPVANMAGDAVRETVRMAAAPAWKAWADSRSARATTATDFIWLCARQKQTLSRFSCADCKMGRASAELQYALTRVLAHAGPGAAC